VTVAEELAQWLRERLTGWREHDHGPTAGHFWEFQDADTGRDRCVMVDGRPRAERVAPAPNRGPLIVGVRARIVVSIELPGTVDKWEMRQALDTLEAAGVIDPPGEADPLADERVTLTSYAREAAGEGR
jgi:hypothetical protein